MTYPSSTESVDPAQGARKSATSKSSPATQSTSQSEGLPKITVVTPSLNQGAYLDTAIRSVLAQDYPNLEYIIQDGGSTDESLDILRRHEQSLTYWISEPDSGPADAINRGFSHATGDILTWLNADDAYLPGAFRSVIDLFVRSPETSLVYGEGWYIDESGQRIEPCRFVRRRFSRTYLVNKDPILQPAAYWRRSLWDTTGPLDTSLRWVFDWEWFIRAFSHGRFQYIPRNLASYRVQPAALTRTGGLARQLEHGRVTRRYGAWWHPNYIVQQTRRIDGFGQRLTNGWPRVPTVVARLPLSVPRLLAEWLLHGMYMR